MMKVKYMLKIH